MLKMYILVKDTVPSNYVPVVCAHASLSCYLKYEHTSDMEMWINFSFKKVVVKVNDSEFELAKEIEKSLVITESSLNNMEVAIVLSPRQNFPEFVKRLPLYSN